MGVAFENDVHVYVCSSVAVCGSLGERRDQLLQPWQPDSQIQDGQRAGDYLCGE